MKALFFITQCLLLAKCEIFNIRSKKQFNNLAKYGRAKIPTLIEFTISGVDCKPCNVIHKTIEELERNIYPKNMIEFAIADYKTIPSIFNEFKLSGVPVVYLFKNEDEKNDYIDYKVSSNGFEVQTLVEFLNNNNIKVKYHPKTDYYLLSKNMAILLVFLTSFYYLRNYFINLFSSYKLWASICFMILITLLSGQMWNSMKSPPYMDQRDKKAVYFDSGFQEQFVLESQVVAFLYGLGALSFVSMCVFAPKIKNNALQTIVAIISALLFLASYSSFMSIFKIKFPPYPFYGAFYALKWFIK